MKSRTPIQHWLSDAWSVIRSAFSCRPTPEELEALPLLQLILPQQMLIGGVPEVLTNHAVQWLMLGFRLQVRKLKEDIPCGCVGIQRLMREGRLLSEDHLRIDPFGRLTFEPISEAVKK